MATERESELVLSQNEFCFLLNRTSGSVDVNVGPRKVSISETDRLVKWDMTKKDFVEVNFINAKQRVIVIPEGWYAPLKNPAERKAHPDPGEKSEHADAGLLIGTKVNIAGPDHFALWPGQMCKVIAGHKLRSNQYLLVRIYDVDAFRSELSAVKDIEASQAEKEDAEGDSSAVTARKTNIYGGIDAENLATGQQFIIRGTDVHFYIPPNGIEVVSVQYGNDIKYVQEAVTLEQLQYCILQDENGEKRYVRGPDVVFPKPTEKFLKHTGDNKVASKKFLAIELNEKSGLYIKVIKPYKDDITGENFAEGQELFITGAEQKIYFPREEHAIVRYGEQDRHYGVALPKGEGRYVLDRVDGGIRTEMGPQMFLPNPIKEVVVKRVLSAREARLLFPGNRDVEKHNASLRVEKETGSRKIMSGAKSPRSREMDEMMKSALSGSLSGKGVTYSSSVGPDIFSAHLDESAEAGVMGDSIDRQGQYAPPRSITLDNKFDGVVAFNVWNGFAVMVVDREGKGRVIEGPKRVYLEYDETPEVLTLSMGRPKDHERTVETVFLRVRNNIVSDVVNVETKDLCGASIQISMHVNFEGDSEEERKKWFAVDNYVKLLCERVGSLLKNHIRGMSVMDFYSNSTDIIRDIILGERKENGRRGLSFEEAGFVVSDVEVLDVNLSDGGLEVELGEEASDALNKALALEKLNRAKEHEKRVLEAKNELARARHESDMFSLELSEARSQKRDSVAKDQKDREKEIQELEIAAKKADVDAELANKVAQQNAIIEADRERLKIQIELMTAEAQKTREVMGAISPDLTAALSALGDNDRIAKLADAVSPQAVFGDEGMLELMKAQFGALGFDSILDRIGLKALPDAAKIDAERAKIDRKKK